ncbi:hypothetical protein WCLP8_1560002 [uncultured Gammaproteobacteria bacterium]
MVRVRQPQLSFALRKRLVWLVAVAVMLQAWLPLVTVVAKASAWSCQEICTVDGPQTVVIGTDGLPIESDRDRQHCPLCWGFGTSAILPQTMASPPPASTDRPPTPPEPDSVYPPALFLSCLKSRAPPAAA